MKVLLICQHFVPYTPSVGGVARVAHLARYLKAQGCDVHILSSTGVDFGWLGFQDLADSMQITYLRDPLKERIQRSILALSGSGRSGWVWRVLKKIKLLLEAVIVPDLGVLMVRRYYRKAKRVIAEDSVDVVLVSTPPHSMQLVGTLLKRHFGRRICYVADYRDSWNASTIFAPKGMVGRAISSRLERQCLSRANVFSYVSRPMLEKLEKFYPSLDIEAKSLLVMNGYAGAKCHVPEGSDTDVIAIGYFGIVDDNETGYRNVEPLLRVLSEAVASGVKLSVHFFGVVRLARLDLSEFPFVTVEGAVDHDKVFESMQLMDYLLVIHTDPSNSDEVMTGKLFDYIKARRPILCYTPENTEAARLVRRLNMGVWLNSMVSAEALEAVKSLAGNSFPALLDDDLVGQFSRDAQYEKLYMKLCSA